MPESIPEAKLLEAMLAVGQYAREHKPVPVKLSKYVHKLWQFAALWLRMDDEMNLTPAEFKEKYQDGVDVALVAEKTEYQRRLEQDQRDLDRILWSARETVDMMRDVVTRRLFAPSNDALTKLLGEIDEYRARHGFSPNGFG